MEEKKVTLDIGSQVPYILKRCGILLAVSLAFFIMSMSTITQVRGTSRYLRYMSVVFLLFLLIYGAFMVTGFCRRLKSLEYTSEGIKVNDDLYISDLSHGVGVDRKMAVSGQIDIGGMNYVVYGMDSSGRRIKKTYWTGPRRNGYCAGKRSELTGLLIAGGAARRERELIKIRDEGQSMKVSFDRTEIKRNRIIRFGTGAAVFAALTLTGIILIAGGYDIAPISAFIFAVAAAVAYYTVKGLADFKTNMKTAAKEITYSKDSLTVNGKTYEITDGLNVDIREIGIPGKATGIIKMERADKKSDQGYYLRIRDGGTEDLYWMGDPIDGPISMVYSICHFISAIRAQESANP